MEKKATKSKIEKESHVTMLDRLITEAQANASWTMHPNLIAERLIQLQDQLEG